MADISIQHLTKKYKGIHALQDVSLHIPSGCLFGLIGPDGAGKTTLFRILSTLLTFDEGDVRIGDYSVRKEVYKIRGMLGYMPGKFSLYQDLSVEENLHFFATIFSADLKSNYSLIADIYKQLEPFKNRRAGKLSGGMKQKLALCCALVHAPPVLLLDEPTTGVDAVSRKEFWDMLEQLKSRGITILVSTPYMDEAERCEKIALIQEGKILAVNTPVGLKKNYSKKLYAASAENMSALLRYLKSLPEINSCYSFGNRHHITLQTANNHVIEDLLNKTRQAGFDHCFVEETAPGIEDCFIELMQ